MGTYVSIASVRRTIGITSTQIDDTDVEAIKKYNKDREMYMKDYTTYESQAKDLEKLNPIIDAELPPFNNFSLTGKLIANKKGYIYSCYECNIKRIATKMG